MGDDDTRTTRRALLTTTAAVGGLGAAGTATANPLEDALDDVLDTTMDLTGALTDELVSPEIETLVRPLAFVPSIREPGEELRLELDAGADVDRAADVTVTVRPSFGEVSPETELEVEAVESGRSELWRDEGARRVTVVRATVPELETEGRLTPGMYDVNVDWGSGDDGQPRAVQFVESFPDEPTVYVVADSHAGDWRATADGIETAVDAGDPEPFLFRYEHNIGIGTDTEKWGAFRRAVAEVSALDPDVVIFPGDLTFGQDVPGKYVDEYLEAYDILSDLRAPVYTTPGNHDGIIQPPLDGKALYRRFFAPRYYSVDVRPDLRVTSFDTHDWGELDRLGVSYGVSAWGGQIRDEQLARLGERLRNWRGANPDATHLAFGHHNPTWRQDEDSVLKRIGSVLPVVEQLTRGLVDVASGGQDWTGANRLAFRDLLSEVETTAYFAGHSHQDRLSRLVGDDVVYTPNGSSRLHRMDRDDEDVTDRYAQDDLTAALLEGDDTLFVNSTTASSGTSQYWGWRRLEFPDGTDALDPSTFGYPLEGPILEERNADVEEWPLEHVDLGRYSHPSFLLEADEVEMDGLAAVVVRNESNEALAGTLRMTLPDCDDLAVDGGDVLWRRRGDTTQDVGVGYEVDATGVQFVEVDCDERGRDGDESEGPGNAPVDVPAGDAENESEDRSGNESAGWVAYRESE